MPRPAASRRRPRAARTAGRHPLDKPIATLLAAGILFVMFPKVLSTLPGLAAMAGLQKIGWMLLALGLAIPTAWGLEVFKVIEWRRFEALFARAGFITRSPYPPIARPCPPSPYAPVR
jgi:hypothetical protein